LPPEFLAPLHRSKPCELPPQGLDFGYAIEADDPAQVSRGVFLERLRSRDTQKGEQDIGDESRPQTVERWAESAVDLPCHRQQATGDQRRNGKQNAGPGEAFRAGEKGRSVFE